MTQKLAENTTPAKGNYKEEYEMQHLPHKLNSEPTEHKHEMLHLPQERAIAAIWSPTEGHTCHCTRNDTEQEEILHLPRQEHLGRTKRHTCHVK